MKKFFAAVIAAFSIVMLGGISAPAMAAPTPTSVSAEVLKATPAVHVTKLDSGTALAAPKQLGTAGVKPFWYYLPSNYCYWAMNGGYYCYRYGCTNFERWFYNCYDGYVRMNTYTWV
jgi:hypothetical protein